MSVNYILFKDFFQIKFFEFEFNKIGTCDVYLSVRKQLIWSIKTTIL